MREKCACLCVGFLSALLALAIPVCAQITALPNGHGVIVYSNQAPANGPASGGRGDLPSLRDETPRERVFAPMVRRLAEQHHLDPRLVAAVIQVESNWNPHAVSPKGAEGLMQLTPATSRRLGVRDAFSPSENVRGGSAYLEDMAKRFGGNLRKTLAAYYAGQGSVDRAGGVPDSPAVTRYIRRVLGVYFHAGANRQSAAVGSGAIYETVDQQGRTVFTNQ